MLSLMMRVMAMEFEIDFDREEDGRWIAEVVDLPGVLAYGTTHEEAQAKAQRLATEITAEQANEK
jgi:predicted RNase H-like HicB family nuclease